MLHRHLWIIAPQKRDIETIEVYHHSHDELKHTYIYGLQKFKGIAEVCIPIKVYYCINQVDHSQWAQLFRLPLLHGSNLAQWMFQQGKYRYVVQSTNHLQMFRSTKHRREMWTQLHRQTFQMTWVQPIYVQPFLSRSNGSFRTGREANEGLPPR